MHTPISVCVCVCVYVSCCHFQPFATPRAHQALLSMEFSRQEYWSGLPFPSPGDLPNRGIEPGSHALQADSLPSEPPGTTPIYSQSGLFKWKSVHVIPLNKDDQWFFILYNDSSSWSAWMSFLPTQVSRLMLCHFLCGHMIIFCPIQRASFTSLNILYPGLLHMPFSPLLF